MGSLISFAFIFLGGLLVDDADHLSLDGFLLQDQSVLVPDEVGVLLVESVLIHAALEQLDDVPVVWVLGETQTSAVVHELSELLWLVFAQLVDGRLFLLLFDGSVLLGLGSAWQTLPWQRALQEVEQDVTDGLQVVSSGLLIAQMSVERGVSSSAR